MGTTLKKIKPIKAKGKFSLFAFHLLLFTFYFLVVVGCDKPFWTPVDLPAAVSVDDLVPEATRIVQQGLADENPYVRVNAIEVVATTKQVKLMPKVQQLLKDDFVPPIRFAAALAVGDMEYRLAEGSIEPLSRDEDENIRIAAAYAKTRLGSADSFDLLCRAVASDDQIVRANAALLLGKTGDKRALAEQLGMLGDTTGEPEVLDVFKKNLTARLNKEQTEHVNMFTALAIGRIGTASLTRFLPQLLGDESKFVRIAAAKAVFQCMTRD